MTNRFTLTAVFRARQEIKKSRFLAIAGPVADEAAAKKFIAIHSDVTAGHNCWAWRIGQNYRFSDDGEPGGTAGKPILAAIDGQFLDNVAVIVARWFGGVLLGSGGLIRAYGGTAAICLHEAERIALIETTQVAVICPFGDLAIVQARIATFSGATIVDQNFTDTGACLDVTVPKEDMDSFNQLIADVSAGRATVKWNE